MRRSPKALERERRLEELISQAAACETDEALRSVIEDPAFPAERAIDLSRRRGFPPLERNTRRGSPADDQGTAVDPAYDQMQSGIRGKFAKEEDRVFSDFLLRLFTAIVQAGALGPIQPYDIELPDPPSYQRLTFKADGTGVIVESPLRARVEEIYRLLNGLDLSRIRECQSCHRLFWARRSDRTGCGKVCANRLRSKRFYHRTNS